RANPNRVRVVSDESNIVGAPRYFDAITGRAGADHAAGQRRACYFAVAAVDAASQADITRELDVAEDRHIAGNAHAAELVDHEAVLGTVGVSDQRVTDEVRAQLHAPAAGRGADQATGDRLAGQFAD